MRDWQDVGHTVPCVALADSLDLPEIYPPVPDTRPDDNVQDARARLEKLGIPDAQIGPGPQGLHYRLGMQMDQWLEQYKLPIQEAVRGRANRPTRPIRPIRPF